MVGMHACMHPCMHACVYACMHVCMHLRQPADEELDALTIRSGGLGRRGGTAVGSRQQGGALRRAAARKHLGRRHVWAGEELRQGDVRARRKLRSVRTDEPRKARRTERSGKTRTRRSAGVRHRWHLQPRASRQTRVLHRRQLSWAGSHSGVVARSGRWQMRAGRAGGSGGWTGSSPRVWERLVRRLVTIAVDATRVEAGSLLKWVRQSWRARALLTSS